jgi:predicted metal-binding protein
VSIWSEQVTIRGPQDLEDVATAGWLSGALFAALDLDLFETIGLADVPLQALADRAGADLEALRRLVETLVGLGLLSLHDNRVACSTVTRRYLLPQSEGYLGHSLRYRQRLAAHWPHLAEAVRRGGSPLEAVADDDGGADGDHAHCDAQSRHAHDGDHPRSADDYRARVRAYMLAMDDVARHKARLIADRVRLDRLPNPRPSGERFVLDIAGGAGAVAAEFIRRHPDAEAVVVDMPEVVEEARGVWTERGDDPIGGSESRLTFVGLDVLSEPLPAPPEDAAGWDVIILSNIVHAFGEAESSALLEAASAALSDDGLIVLQDFWTDGPGRGPAKSALFDLHMLINTYQGRTYPWAWARDRLAAAGLSVLGPVPLGEGLHAEDTALVIGARSPAALAAVDVGPLDRVRASALDLGFVRTTSLEPSGVLTAAWVREKCRFGCAGYDTGAQCPPRSPAPDDTRKLLSGYRRALLVQGEPPTAGFHERMLTLERAAFLAGFPRALVFVAGPCRLCPICEPDACRRPADARPSMEAAGIDVYGTAEAAGWRLEPVPDRESPVTYLGLLLVD